MASDGRGGRADVRRLTRGVAAAAGALLLAAGQAAGADGPTSFQRLVTRVMLEPQFKSDSAAKRITFSTRTVVFPVPTDPARPIDPQEPSTFMRVFAEVTLTDNEPFALTPAQLGAEDALLTVLRTEGTQHIFWQKRDPGLKGPGESASKQLVPLFGEDPQAKYRDVVDRINAALDAEAAKGRTK